MTALVKFGTS